MAMPDGVDALLTLAAAPRERLTRSAYNLSAFNPSAADDPRRRRRGVSRRGDHLSGGREAAGDRRLVAGGGGRLGGARATGDSSPTYDFDRAFREYLIPTIRERYHR